MRRSPLVTSLSVALWPRSANRTAPLGWALLAAALLVAGSSASAATIRKVLDSDRVALHNLVGDLTVVPGHGPSIVAEITLQGRDAGRLRVDSGPLRGLEMLRVIYPSDRIHVPGFMGKSTFWVREDGTLDGRIREGRRVELSGRGGGLEARADVKLYVPRGHRVGINWGHGSADIRGVDAGIAIEGASMDVRSSGCAGGLAVEVGSGSVHLDGNRGNVSVETGSGDVEVRDSDVEHLVVETGSGTIRAMGVAASGVSLETGSGDIDADGIRTAKASLETGSGRVELRLRGDAENVVVESGSGDVTVTVPEGMGAAVHMETGSGEVEASVPLQITRQSRHELKGTIGDGQGRLSMETGSGRVALVSAGR